MWLSSLAIGTPYARGEMRSRGLPRLRKQHLSILSQNLRGLKKRARRPRSSFASRNGGCSPRCSKRRGRLVAKCGRMRASRPSSTGARGQENVGTSRLAALHVRVTNPGNTTHLHGPAQAPSQLLPRERVSPDTSQSPEKRDKNPKSRERKLLTAQRLRTYTHLTRPIKLLGPPHAYPHPAPTGHAPVGYAARCLHVPPGSNS